MKFGLDVPTSDAYADPRQLAQLAAEAEAAGWDGFFIWDVLLGDNKPVVDPWIALTAIALQTSRLNIGLLALPLARHRPWLVARQLANLDRLSQGRVICIAGLGHSERDFSAFAEESAPVVRAQKLDEALEILNGLWTTDQFSFAGQHYTLDGVTLNPRPLQSPRIPLWLVGGWPNRAPFRRAARWDGACLKSINAQSRKWLSPAEFRACFAYLQSQRTASTPFDVIVSGETPHDTQEASAIVQPFAESGATWWIEEGLGWSFEEFRQRINAGPPRL